ncbi:hypothetical protein J3F83DRAFT_727218 [Trichoderma novae-zelandiae]
MGSQQFTLFDLPSKEPNAAWSLNPWKIRLLLNYKGLDYKTEWLNYPEIAPRLRPHLPPNETGRAYSIPAIQFPDGTYMMDSRKIAEAIDQKHPSPPVHLDTPIVERIEQLTLDAIKPLYPILMHKISQAILADKSYDYWVGQYTRELGMPLDEYERRLGGDKSWEAARPALSELTRLLVEEKQAEGPFFLGKEVGYADFVWVGGLVFVKRVDEGVFRELLDRTGAREAHERLLEACEPWLRRNDY